jgi:hypothetical protein
MNHGHDPMGTPFDAGSLPSLLRQCEVIVAKRDLGRGIVGIIDGGAPFGVESGPDIDERKALLRLSEISGFSHHPFRPGFRWRTP